MSEKTAQSTGNGALHSFMDELPTDQLKQELGSFLGALAHRAIAVGTEKVGSATDKLSDYAENGGPTAKALKAAAPDLAQGKPLRGLANAAFGGVKGMISKAFGGGGGKGGGKGLKVTNIVEYIDVGAPLDLTYNVWTQFQDFPTFMKKVETVNQEEEAKLNWKAQVFWSHRSWRSTITEQIPDNRIVWKSEGDKGHVDGTVTFHAIGHPELTRVLVVLEYHPAGVVENIGNLWRAQGRRVRLELKHFRRHVMTQVITNPDEVEGWRGEIRDGQVVSDGEARDQEDGDRQGRGEDETRAGDEEREYDEDRADDENRAGQDYDEDEDHDEDRVDQDYDEDEEDEDEAGYDEDREPQGARRGGSDRGGEGRSSRRQPVKAGSRSSRRHPVRAGAR
ncbi:MAG TPA: SRPBCC family protein [Streptosporangiaceae bacterium]